MCSAAALPKFIKVQSDVCQFSIGSKWLYKADSRFDAAAYSEGAFRALEEIEACGYPTESLGQLCGTIWHPVQTQARSNFKRIYTKPEYGVPFVSSRNTADCSVKRDSNSSVQTSCANVEDLSNPSLWQ